MHGSLTTDPTQDTPQKTLDPLLSSAEYSLRTTILYAIALSSTPSPDTSTALRAIKRHLAGVGVYGGFPIIVPLHGAGGEVCQAFCRACAVRGGTYILGRGIRSVSRQGEQEEGYKVCFEVEEGDELPLVYCKHVVREKDLGVREQEGERGGEQEGEQEETRSIGIVEGFFEGLFKETGYNDAALIIVPPETVRKEQTMPIQIIIHGGGIGECPPGQCTPHPSL
jgi:Rab proteins geranylgeranyltransferase component A